MTTQDPIIIIGAGIIGLSVAWHARSKGLRVIIVDEQAKSGAASVVAAGMLAPVTEAAFGEEQMLRINLEGAGRYTDFLQRLSHEGGEQIALDTDGTLFVALDRDQTEVLHHLFDFQISLGLNVQWLGAAAARELEPGLHPSTRAAILAPQDRAVDPRDVMAALGRAINAQGPIERHTTAARSIRLNGQPAVLLATGERLSASQIVLSAGCWSGQIAGVPAFVAESLRPVKGQILRLLPTRGAPVIRHVIRTEDAYLVPRSSGEIVVGATVEDRGFETTLTAGGVFELLRAAEEALPGIREMELAETSVGLRPNTPDNGPMLGPAADGLVMATGHYRNGVLLAPITAEAITTLLETGETAAAIRGFSPIRFKRA